MKVGPSPARARATAWAAASYTARTSLPSTLTPGRPCATARGETSALTCRFESGVSVAYRLFSHTKTTGSRLSAANARLSCVTPCSIPAAPVAAQHDVLLRERLADADGHRLLADRQVRRAADLLLRVPRDNRLLGAADARHLHVEALEALRREGRHVLWAVR